ATISSGNSQIVHVGAGAATKPAVLIKDAFGNLVSGATVTFNSIGGGGSATGTTPATNASGIATLGTWTMGSSNADNAHGIMTNTINAAASGTNTVTFTDSAFFNFSTDAGPLLGTGFTGNPCSGCHNFPNGWTYASIVNVTSGCSSLKYVLPGNATSSDIYNKISTGTPTCGSEMPAGGPFFSAAQQKMVRAWINNGALNN